MRRSPRQDDGSPPDMPTPQPESGHRYGLATLLQPRSLRRLALIGAVVAAIAAAFAWTGGLFSPGRLDQARIVDTFQEVSGGIHPGFRRNHAKGVCLTGYFDSNGAAASYSKAAVFRAGRVPVFGRFSLAGGMPMIADSPSAIHALGLNFATADGEVWRTAMIDLPVFPVRDVQAFYEQLAATKPAATGGKTQAEFLAAHPETARAMSVIKAHPFASGFTNATYNSLNAFLLIDASGRSTPVRWSLVPLDAFAPAQPNASGDKNYLFDDLLARVRREPVQWHLVLTLGQPEDRTNDASVAWPESRQRIDAGTLTVTGLETEGPGNCRDIEFDPLVLPSGIAPSDDPILSARSATYAVSFTRRAGEPKTPSAVQIGTGN